MGRPRGWIVRLARLGFAVKGIVYLLLGGLALRVAIGSGGRLTDARGAVATLLAAPFGRVVVASVAVGLALYAGWRFLEAFADANQAGSGMSGIGTRAVYAFSGSVYGLLAFDAALLAWGSRASGDSLQLPTTLVGRDLAEWLAWVIALVLVGYGAAQLRRAFSATLSDRLSLARVERDAGPWPVRVSRVGIAGRAVVLVMMGIVLARRAGTSADAAAATDSADSLRLVAALPTGSWLLAGVAAGLMAYGVFQLVQARYRRIVPP